MEGVACHTQVLRVLEACLPRAKAGVGAVYLRPRPGTDPPLSNSVVLHTESGEAGGRLRSAISLHVAEVSEALLDIVLGHVPVEMNESTHVVSFGSTAMPLTRTQFALFACLHSVRPGWISAPELQAKAFGTHHTPDSSIVRVHVHHLKQALGGFAPLIRSARQIGYRLQVLPAGRASAGSGMHRHSRIPTVLVVDDDPFSLRWMARALEKAGMKATLVRWPHDPLPGEVHDVAVVDFFLGSDCGAEVARSLRGSAARSTVLVSAHPTLASEGSGVEVIDKAGGESAMIDEIHRQLSLLSRRNG